MWLYNVYMLYSSIGTAGTEYDIGDNIVRLNISCYKCFTE